ncbi:MAG: DUF5691 domain-containing protein [Cyanobacteria bacterium P01_F01_bin.150]
MTSSPWPVLIKAALMGTHRQSSLEVMLAPILMPTSSPPTSSPPTSPPSSSQASVQPSNKANSPRHQLYQTLAKLNWTEPETAILDAAGAIATHTQAGQPHTISIPHPPNASAPVRPDTPVEAPPLRSPTPPLPCSPAPPPPLCSPQTAKHLRHGLRHDPDFCAEILIGLTSYHQRMPDEYLPSLLDFGLRYPQWQALITQAMGERGRWLANQNPDWHYGRWNWLLLPPDDLLSSQKEKTPAKVDSMLPQELQELWQEGAIAQRLELLQRWRTIAPNAARTLLVEKWPKELAKHRAILLPGLRIGLSLNDESFLDQVLSDKSSSVRTTATHLLSCLPASQWCQRMTEWGRSLFHVQHHPSSIASASASAIHINLPNADSKATTDLSRLRKSSKAPSKKRSSAQNSNNIANHRTRHSTHQPPTEEKALETLVQIVGSMALEFWNEYSSPWDLLQLISHQQYGNAVIQGWVLATIRQRDRKWATALLQHSKMINGAMGDANPNRPDLSRYDHQAITDLLHILPYPQQENFLVEWIPLSTRQQISLLASPHCSNIPYSAMAEQGAAEGLAMVGWLQLAVAIDNTAEAMEKSPFLPLKQMWSLDFSRIVLLQLHREISHQMPTYIQSVRTLAGAIASRLDPCLNDEPILAALAERTIPGPVYLERSWDQSIDMIRSTLSLRQAMQASFNLHRHR